MDVSKLTAAPWYYDSYSRVYSSGHKNTEEEVSDEYERSGSPQPDGHMPAEWKKKFALASSCVCQVTPSYGDTATDNHQEDAIFIAMARNDLEVKMRRGWGTEKNIYADVWFVPILMDKLIEEFIAYMPDEALQACCQKHHDVGLLSKADAWLTAREESKSRSRSSQ